MWRAGFGPAADQLELLKDISPKTLFKTLQKTSAARPSFIDVADNQLRSLVMEAAEINPQQKRRELNEEERRLVRQKQREGVRQLNLSWLSQMVKSQAQLREKMAFFWHGHFASRNLNVFFQQQLLDILRQHALGSFKTLLHEVSKSASVLNFLNAAQNKKGHPNENFAREVMELFTLGRGHYSENDIKEAARAFTGWSANLKGEFVFRPFQHDRGNKTVLGISGNLQGEDVLDILLQQKQTASYITQKIYRFFVNENVDQEKVAWLADRFYNSDYNIGALMEDIFTSDWFYDKQNIGALIKSPIELIAGVQRILPMTVDNEDALLFMQRLLGQMLFYPPNVAGWPGGKNWIDSSSLMVRMRLPQLINDTDELTMRPKTDDDMSGGREEEMTPGQKGYARAGKPIQATVNWSAFIKRFETTKREHLLAALQNTLLQVTPRFDVKVIQSFSDSSSRENFIRTCAIQMMSTPEYQMC